MSTSPGNGVAIPSVSFLNRANRVIKAFEGTPQFRAGSFIPNRGTISPFVGHADGTINSGLDPENANHGGEITLLGESESVRAFAGMLDGSDTIADGNRVEGLCINGIYRIFNADCESGEED